MYPIFQYAQADAFFRGVDLDAKLPLLKWHSLSDQELNYELKGSVVFANEMQTKRYFPFIPAPRINQQLKWNVERNRGLVRNFAVGIGHTFVAQQTRFEPAQELVPTTPDAYHLFEANIETKLKIGGQQTLGIRLSAENLLNTEYKEYTNRFRYYAHDLGRNVFVRLIYNFKKTSKKMKKISYYLKAISMIILVCFAVSGCSKDDSKPKPPTDETKDRGHDMPDKVQFIITDKGTKVVQERTANKSPKGIVYDINNPIQWQVGHEYLFEIVYYNNGVRMNHEFVTAEMAPIHQHFFQLFQGNYPENKEGRDAMVTAMNKVVSYEYQDTDPENSTYGTQGVKLRLRTWDKKHPELRDPVGLKGFFHIKDEATVGNYTLRIKLAHFLTANKLNPQNQEERPYNVVEYSNAFQLDSDMTLPIEIKQ